MSPPVSQRDQIAARANAAMRAQAAATPGAPRATTYAFGSVYNQPQAPPPPRLRSPSATRRAFATATTPAPRSNSVADVRATLDEISARAATAARQLGHAARQQSQPPSSTLHQQQRAHHPQHGDAHHAAPPGGGASSAAAAADAAAAALRTDEIRRIVDKVERHFAPQLEHLQATAAQLQADNERLRGENEALARRALAAGSQQHSHSAAGAAAEAAVAAAVETLRAELTREKRQRFECEEQGHRLAEEHARYVETMERRLRKSEALIADLQAQTDRTTARGTPRSVMRRPALGHSPPLSARGASAAGAASPTVVSVVAGLDATPPNHHRQHPHQQQQYGRADAGATTGAFGGSSSFFDSVAKQLDDINSREASRAAIIRQLL